MHVYVDSKLLIVFPSPLQVPGHLDEGRCRLQLKWTQTTNLYTLCIISVTVIVSFS